MEQLAIISDVGYGLRDTNQPMLFFTVKSMNGSALLCFSQPEADKLIKEFGVYDIKYLNGKGCIITIIDNLIKFVRKF